MPEQKSEDKSKKDIPACCVGCVRWEKFGKQCWYYWEGKSTAQCGLVLGMKF